MYTSQLDKFNRSKYGSYDVMNYLPPENCVKCDHFSPCEDSRSLHQLLAGVRVDGVVAGRGGGGDGQDWVQRHGSLQVVIKHPLYTEPLSELSLITNLIRTGRLLQNKLPGSQVRFNRLAPVLSFRRFWQCWGRVWSRNQPESSSTW